MKKTILATDYFEVKLNPYQVKTKGRHPVRWVAGGSYLIEDFDVEVNPAGDLGYWWLNQKDYDEFRRNLKEVSLEEVCE